MRAAPVASAITAILAAVLAIQTMAAESSTSPPELPLCLETASLTIAYRDPLMGRAETLRPESLLFGRTAFWPTALESADCDESVSLVELFLDEAPVPLHGAAGGFALDLGRGLRSYLVRVELTLRNRETGASRTVERTVRTMDASVAQSGSGRSGSRLRESRRVLASPSDRLVLTMSVTGPDDEYVLDVTKDELKLVLGSVRTLRGDALIELNPPSENLPVRLLIAFDVSGFLERTEAGLRFVDDYRRLVDHSVLPGLQAAAPSPLPDSSLPPIEVGFVRYAQTAEWFVQPFLRLDRGISARDLDKLRSFLLAPPRADWIPGQADTKTTMEAMKGLWHFFRGRRGVLLAPRGRVVFSGRLQQIFSPSVLKPQEDVEEQLAEVTRRLEKGDGAIVQSILQHTERRFPKIHVWLPIYHGPAVERGFGELVNLAGQTGGSVFTYDIKRPGDTFRAAVQATLDDLIRSYRLTVEIPNPQQKPVVKEAMVRVLRRDVEVRAPRYYKSSADLCHYLPSYLIDQDPLLRLVAAASAGSCRESSAVDTLVVARLLGPANGREASPLVLKQLLRSYVQIRLRRIQDARSRRRREQIYQELIAIEVPPELLEPALLESYREIGRALAGR
ncbi:MAG: hypothetical protein O6851_00705 [Gemmatimonadetes bacterium]|nr:hypothetical protein [Gemmatimonadota bacterium]